MSVVEYVAQKAVYTDRAGSKCHKVSTNRQPSPTRYICLTLSQDDTSAEFMRKVALKHMLFVTRLERALISYLVKEFECCLFTLKPDWSLADSI